MLGCSMRKKRQRRVACEKHIEEGCGESDVDEAGTPKNGGSGSRPWCWLMRIWRG